MDKKSVLLKISGQLFSSNNTTCNKAFIVSIVEQIKALDSEITFGIVVGGGNFFRGGKEGSQLELSRTTADTVGMLATVMNSLILQDFFIRNGLGVVILSSINAPQIVPTLEPSALHEARSKKKQIIFAGGTGNPYFSTDTSAVIRALQIGASEIWKATKVDYVYDSDPENSEKNTPIRRLSYDEALAKKLAIMDSTALTLAQEHNLTVRVFNIFAENSLVNAAHDKNLGSTITKNM